MANILIQNVRIVQPGIGILDGCVQLGGGRITAVETSPPAIVNGGTIVDGMGGLLTPGLIDMHTHGILNFHYERGGEDLQSAAACLSAYGTTTIVPTVVPQVSAECFATLAELASTIPKVSGVCIPGLHLEGPFGVVGGSRLWNNPGDVGLLEELIAACQNRVAVMSISPDAPNIIPVIERLCELGVVPFITHTQATVEQTLSAIDAGARHATHFYNVFPVPEVTDIGVRPVGAVESILADPRATCDFICDGVHVHPVAIRAAVAAKSYRGVSLITDSTFGAGLGPETYDTPWGYPVHIEPGDAPRIADPEHPLYGALSGSALTMNRGISNLLSWLELPEEEIWAMGTSNPATVLGLAQKGRLSVGADADLVLWEQGEILKPARTWVAGEEVFRARMTTNTAGLSARY